MTFSTYARQYQDNGFVPLPWRVIDGKKRPVAKGYLKPDPPVDEWIERFPKAEIGIVAHAWLGIDVDAAEHDDKAGDQTILELSRTLGELPPTISSTARGDDSLSRIHFFGVPDDGRRYRDVGKDVEAIRPGHRFAAVAPSVHPNGSPYRWYDASGQRLNGIPSIYEFAPLPEKWIEYLTAPERSSTGGYEGDIDEWLARLPGYSEDLPEELLPRLSRLTSDFGHSQLVASLTWLAERGGAGALGVRQSIDFVRRQWLRGDWNDDKHQREFDEALDWAILNAGGYTQLAEEDEEEAPPEDAEWLELDARFKEAAAYRPEVDQTALADALRVSCRRIAPDWAERQFEPEVSERFRKCLRLLAKVRTEEDAAKWLAATKKIMARALGEAP